MSGAPPDDVPGNVPDDVPGSVPLSDGVRLQKALAARGVGSRRVVEDMIDAGRITVNGQVARLGRRIDAATDVVELDGVLVGVAPDRVHYLLHKPSGVVSTAADTHGRPTVIDLVPDDTRIWPVGRLDLETEGLLLMTNDGELTHRLTHPSFSVDKEYLAELDGAPSRGDLRAWRQGVELEDGPTAPAKASLMSPQVLRLTIHEGRNRQVRRMCAARGFQVLRLVRTRIGPLTDTTLKSGEWRELSVAEVRALETATGGN